LQSGHIHPQVWGKPVDITVYIKAGEHLLPGYGAGLDNIADFSWDNSIMTDRDPKDASEKNLTPSNGDVEHMSKDEKLAFEKIMGDIGDADQNTSTSNDGATLSDAGAEPALDTDDALTEDQQAALDKIMADINGNEEPDQAPQVQNDADEQDDDQQTAPDKIATGTGGNDQPDPAPQAQDGDAQVQGDVDELDDDQQAALDKIMAEISGNDKPVQASQIQEDDTKVQGEADELDDDQQAALDKIMAEINGNDNPVQDPQAQEDDAMQDNADELDDDQQAALDKIMAEIESKDKHSVESDGEAAPESPAIPPREQKQDETQPEKKVSVKETAEKELEEPDKINLSLEEFNDELNNLLSNANPGEITQQDPDPDIPGSPSSENAASMEDSASAGIERTQDLNIVDAPASSRHQNEEYAILTEITDTEDKNDGMGTPNPRRKHTPSARLRNAPTRKKRFWLCVAAALLLSLGGAAYWWMVISGHDSASVLKLTELAPAEPHPDHEANTETVQPQSPNDPSPSLAVASDASEHTSEASGKPTSTFSSLRDEISAARNQILQKIDELRDLKAYYQDGIIEEQNKIKLAAGTAKAISLKAALKDGKTELGLRAIQRRMVYLAKLDIPVRQLTSSSEELLFLERKTRLFEILNQGISGIAMTEFKQETSAVVSKLLKMSHDLSIDQIKMDPPSFESIWKDMQFEKAQKQGPHKLSNIDIRQDKEIFEEICKGDFHRKYLLTTISPQAAECLASWTGKDLYLNELAELTPDIAKIISQWPGEWLSLNGLKELSPDAAEFISQWPGKRLSLNGLARLSQQATQHLSNWKGEQLEMVGLETIGRWENYGTRLYLSENLRRKLHLQE